MICSERTTRVLPGLSQALDWLRQNLPQPQPAPQPVLVPVRARPQRGRAHVSRYVSACAAHDARGRFGRD